ncbi:hypothetical protein [Acinetobacter baylyi]|uniref:hypothetical protein n=1 Tax=Acinetobacter baylyi TaxID=202950 RepID=UPI000EA2DFA3|nr:hypothetical protein [Acinetobacter baylyi]
MNLIEIEPHFWELYQNGTEYYLSLAVDLSSVVSCWDIVLTQPEITAYQTIGRDSIVILANQYVAQLYRGDATRLEQQAASDSQKLAMLTAFKTWQAQQDLSI